MDTQEDGNRKPYAIDFYVDGRGRCPFERWVRELSPTKRRALTAGLEEILAARGIHVCEDEFGKNLGGGLYEFRLRQMAEDVLKRAGVPLAPDTAVTRPEKILLRAFFHPHGEKRVLLLGGYDKLARPSHAAQAAAIEEARKRLAHWLRQTKSTSPAGGK